MDSLVYMHPLPADRGCEVTDEVIDGPQARRLTNKEIAARLSVTSAAVKKRLESVYAKLDVNTRREAVAAAVARGFIRTPSL